MTQATLARIKPRACIHFGAGATIAWRMADPGVGRARWTRRFTQEPRRLPVRWLIYQKANEGA